MKVKSTVSKEKRSRSSIPMWIVLILCMVAAVLMVYNIFIGNFWYVACYAIGILLGMSYVSVKRTELYKTYVATDGEKMYFSCWDNCFFPYQTLFNLKFFAELLPAKVVKLRVPISEVKLILLGTKTFIKRNTENEDFRNAVALYEKTKYNANQRLLEKMDIFYLETIDGDSLYMNVSDFNAKAMMKIFQVAESQNSGIDIRANGREYRRYMTKKDS